MTENNLKETEKGLIPENWDVVKLSSIAEIIMGQSPKGETYNSKGNGTPLINGPVEFGRVYPIPIQWTTAPTKFSRINDILFCVRGNTTGKMNLSDKEYCIGRGVAAIRAKENLATTEFLYFLLEFFRSKIYSYAVAGGSTFPNISKYELQSLKVICPSIDEQKQISHILSLIQSSIHKQEQIIRTTIQLKNVLMKKLFSEGMKNEPLKETEIGLIPESWELVKIGDVITLSQYGLSVKGNKNGVGYPILRMTNQQNGKIVERVMQHVDLPEREIKKFRVDDGDILFNRTNSIDLVGRTSIFDLKGDFVFASYLIRLKTKKDQLNPYYLNIYFGTEQTQKRLKLIATRGVSQSNISATRLSTFVIPLPSLNEQTEIVRCLNSMENKINFHKRKKQSLQSLFQSLLHQLMTGSIRIKDSAFAEAKS